MTQLPRKTKTPGALESTSGPQAGYGAPPEVFALGEQDPQALGWLPRYSMRRRERWRGGTILDHQHPVERCVGWAGAGVFFLAIWWLFHGNYLGIGACLIALVAFGLAAHQFDAYWVASPADRELIEVVGVGPLCVQRRRFAFDQVSRVVLGGWNGRDLGQRSRSDGGIPFRLRQLWVDLADGTRQPLTWAETPGPKAWDGGRALAERMGAKFWEEPAREVGGVRELPGDHSVGADLIGLVVGLVTGHAVQSLLRAIL